MAVVVDVTNGDVLAMASVDGATASAPARVARSPATSNAPLMDLFEPGSTNKLITLVDRDRARARRPDTDDRRAARRSRSATSSRTRDVDRDGDVHWSVTDILRESSNIGTIEIAQTPARTSSSPTRCARSGSAQTTRRLPGPGVGLLLDPDAVLRHRARVDRDRLRRRGDRHADARRVRDDRERRRDAAAAPARRDDRREGRAARRRALARARASCRTNTAATMTEMLDGVVRAAPARARRFPGYTVAGKTGTARKAVDGGYSDRHDGVVHRLRAGGRTRGSRRSSCSTSPRPSTAARPRRRCSPTSCSSRCTQYGVAPDDVAQHAVRRRARRRATAGQQRARCRTAPRCRRRSPSRPRPRRPRRRPRRQRTATRRVAEPEAAAATAR